MKDINVNTWYSILIVVECSKDIYGFKVAGKYHTIIGGVVSNSLLFAPAEVVGGAIMQRPYLLKLFS